MEQIVEEQLKFDKSANLRKSIDETQALIDQLKQARQKIEADEASGPLALAKLQGTVKSSFEKMNDNLKEINKVHGRFGKAINSKYKDIPHPLDSSDNLSEHTDLINRAIMMHLSREGAFDVVSTFAAESQPTQPHPKSAPSSTAHYLSESVSDSTTDPAALKTQFTNMYTILEQLRMNQDIDPAIEWARERSAVLEARGSNLEFDLCRLRYIKLFTSTAPGEGPLAAIEYARNTFHRFPQRYSSQIQQLTGALAFIGNLADSPYSELFTTPIDTATAAAASQFTAEFCALLSLSSASPLLTAVTAGCIALPRLLKFMQIQSTTGVSWTSSNELPVEIELPKDKYNFHSIFVCPVSKEQGTEANPPMMLPCGHVLCRESMETVAKGTKFKCPYCPMESHMNMARELFL